MLCNLGIFQSNRNARVILQFPGTLEYRLVLGEGVATHRRAGHGDQFVVCGALHVGERVGCKLAIRGLALGIYHQIDERSFPLVDHAVSLLEDQLPFFDVTSSVMELRTCWRLLYLEESRFQQLQVRAMHHALVELPR